MHDPGQLPIFIFHLIENYAVCSIPPETGSHVNDSFCRLFGENQLRRWYFDTKTGSCRMYSSLLCTLAWAQPFWKTKNIFGTEYQCMRRCAGESYTYIILIKLFVSFCFQVPTNLCRSGLECNENQANIRGPKLKLK